MYRLSSKIFQTFLFVFIFNIFINIPHVYSHSPKEIIKKSLCDITVTYKQLLVRYNDSPSDKTISGTSDSKGFLVQKDVEIYLVLTKHALVKHMGPKIYQNGKPFTIQKTNDLPDYLEIENDLLGVLRILLPCDKAYHMEDHSYILKGGTADVVVFDLTGFLSPEQFEKVNRNIIRYENLADPDTASKFNSYPTIVINNGQNFVDVNWQQPFDGVIKNRNLQLLKGFKFDPSFNDGFSGSPFFVLDVDFWLVGMLIGPNEALSSIVIRDAIDNKNLYYREKLATIDSRC